MPEFLDFRGALRGDNKKTWGGGVKGPNFLEEGQQTAENERGRWSRMDFKSWVGAFRHQKNLGDRWMKGVQIN